jgi:hypothetical protein
MTEEIDKKPIEIVDNADPEIIELLGLVSRLQERVTGLKEMRTWLSIFIICLVSMAIGESWKQGQKRGHLRSVIFRQIIELQEEKIENRIIKEDIRELKLILAGTITTLEESEYQELLKGLSPLSVDHPEIIDDLEALRASSERAGKGVEISTDMGK